MHFISHSCALGSVFGMHVLAVLLFGYFLVVELGLYV
jgi:hypothetical protein